MKITARVRSRGRRVDTITFESTTATRQQLKKVDQPERLPERQRNAYYARLSQLDLQAVAAHRSWINSILADLNGRAAGPKDGEVHKAIDQAGRLCKSTLLEFEHQATSGQGSFDERKLVGGLQIHLRVLKEKVPDKAATDKDIEALAKARNQIGDVLARAEAGIKAWVKGASIAYRGSLATGWRNENKSEKGVAQRINLLKFDSDAFVEIPDATWKEWSKLKIVPTNKVDNKMFLTELIGNARRAGPGDGVNRVKAQLAGIQEVENQLREAMKSVYSEKVIAYKMKGRKGSEVADFEFVLQPSTKTAKELKYGNLYPLGEVAAAGLPLAEADLDVVVESGVIKVRMPERHVSMSAGVAHKTYASDPDSPTHTSLRPTERMYLDEYFAHTKDPVKALKPTTTKVTGPDFKNDFVRNGDGSFVYRQ